MVDITVDLLVDEVLPSAEAVDALLSAANRERRSDASRLIFLPFSKSIVEQMARAITHHTAAVANAMRWLLVVWTTTV
jgi:hypothetical protein